MRGICYFFHILVETDRITPTTMHQMIVSATSPNTSTRHGKYSGANTSRISQASGYPYHIAPSSIGGVFETKPVKRAISSPPTTEKITILFAFTMFHMSSSDVGAR